MKRNVTYRLIPGSRSRARRLSALAGACRFVWNRCLAENREAMEAWEAGKGEKPSTSFFALAKRFTALRREIPWLGEMAYKPVRHALKYQADAWQAYFAGRAKRPRFHDKGRGDSVTLPSGTVRIDNDRLNVPRIGPMRLRRRGRNPYPEARPVQAVITRRFGKWYATVCYDVNRPGTGDDGRVLGADMNVRQVTAHTGAMLVAPNLARLEARRRRYQRIAARRRKGSKRQARARHLVAKTSRRIAQQRRAWRHRATRALADSAGLVVIEDLNTKAMTASAKGTAEKPGTNVQAKAGLNREILATGWGEMKAMLAYKANAIEVVHPAYTSQRCAACGHTAAKNRTTQARFACRTCGHTDHADVNAAKNILASATGAAGRGEALALATSTIRQQVSERDIVKLWI